MPCLAQCLRVSIVSVSVIAGLALTPAHASHSEARSSYVAQRATADIRVDGTAREPDWDRAEWRDIKYRWLGPAYTADDFSGRFKVVWTPERIYILAEIVDDILFDAHRDPLVQYWDDDCLEIFLDADYSGGEHQFNHNAFAYHMSLDNRAIDIGTDRNARDYTHHVQSRWRQYADKLVWEIGIDIYDDNYVDGSSQNQPMALVAGQILGLMIAYCDNDGSELRENFIGSESVPSGPKDRGWIDAGLFGEVILGD